MKKKRQIGYTGQDRDSFGRLFIVMCAAAMFMCIVFSCALAKGG